MAERPQHAAALALLEALDAPLLRAAGCWFGGGTAVSLLCDEYRVSADVDFLCASGDGYRALRERVFDHGLHGLFARAVVVARGARTDRYGIRAVIEVAGVALKFEIVREGRVALAGIADPELPVDRLTDEDLVTEKLLANADRFLDDATLGRDAFDLLMLEERLGGLPESAWEKARAAYGASVDHAFERALRRLRDEPQWVEAALATLDVRPGAREMLRRRISRVAPTPGEVGK